ncbi:MAG: PepSY-associated TM helix domain-containing protein [Planctomycetaceae bacterium]|nr:PepSY-associated TM helix domain-containing protein [Planctomycetaceae bacterium]
MNDSPEQTPPSPVPRRSWFNQCAGWVRWLHLYSSMLGLGVTLFFSITGLTLNHPHWFPLGEQVRESTGELSPEWLSDPLDPDQLQIVEHLRSEHGIKTRLRDFTVDEYQYLLAFAGPGYSADVQVDPESGTYQLREVQLGVVPWINDLHKGRDTSGSWSILIDVSALLLAFISVSGLLMILWLKRRMFSSALIAILGTIVLAVLAFWLT